MSNDKQILYERKTIVNIEGCQLPVVLSEAVTLRDKFAMAALTGIASRDGMSSADYMSRLAYELADAMLEARK